MIKIAIILLLLLILLFSQFIFTPLHIEPLTDTDISLNTISYDPSINPKCMFPMIKDSALDTLHTFDSKKDKNVEIVLRELIESINAYIYNSINPQPLIDFQNSAILQPFVVYTKKYPNSSDILTLLQSTILTNMSTVYNQNKTKCTVAMSARNITSTPTSTSRLSITK